MKSLIIILAALMAFMVGGVSGESSLSFELRAMLTAIQRLSMSAIRWSLVVL